MYDKQSNLTHSGSKGECKYVFENTKLDWKQRKNSQAQMYEPNFYPLCLSLFSHCGERK